MSISTTWIFMRFNAKIKTHAKFVRFLTQQFAWDLRVMCVRVILTPVLHGVYKFAWRRAPL